VPPVAANSLLERLFARVIALRWWVVAAYALTVPFALVLALRIPRDNAIERMVVDSDHEVAVTREFQRVFPEMPTAFLLLETGDPFDPVALGALRGLQSALDRVPGVVSYSLLTVWERVRPGGGVPSADELRAFSGGTGFLRRQGLVGPGFLGVVLLLDVEGAAQRDRALAGIDEAISATGAGRGPITAVRRVGAPWIDAWLERETAASSVRYFPLFGIFVVGLTLALYRSKRALAAILVSLAVAVLLGVAFGALVGFAFTIVSALVPLTLMITCTASLVYLHSRFIDQEPGTDLDAHRLFALRNKFVAVSASVFAAAVGFLALAVSHIRPVRELGIWVAVGLTIGWFVCFTLYPALQVVLRTPTRGERAIAGTWVAYLAERLPRWSYLRRWVLLPLFGVVAAAGLAALVGVPGALAPMRLQTEALDYVDRSLPVYTDTRAFAERVLGLTSISVWVTAPPGAVVEGAFLTELDSLSRALEADPAVGSVVGLPAVLRLRRYAAGLGDALPTDPGELERLGAELEQLLLTEPALRTWVDTASLGSTYLTVTSRAGSDADVERLATAVGEAWGRVGVGGTTLARSTYRLAGRGVLQATIAKNLVPTLTESFSLTFGIIFVTFLFVFRSGVARLNAMVPSLFAILATFLLMRLLAIPLNVATILIATTVLGATENDQIHFFYHFQERRGGTSTEAAMRHAIRVAGHGIIFATLINAAGFLALAVSNFPPMRQFGIVTATAFALALLADFTALPAALWVFFRERPAGLVDAGPGG
jgi:uncharacterized protein